MIRVAVAIAFAALFVSIGALVVPGAVTEELSWRAAIGASISTSIAIILGAIALLLTAKVESADYKAEQQIKYDLARLHAALSSAQVRAGIKLDVKLRGATNFSQEKLVAHEFLQSVTGFAFYMLTARKSEESRGSPEEWRLFHLYIAELVESSDVSVFLNRATRVQRLLSELTSNDIDSLCSSVRDLSGSAANFGWAIEKNLVLRAMNEVYGGKATADVDDNSAVLDRLAYLKSIGVEDPDIDLFIAVHQNDTTSLKSALDRGANMNVTDKQILSRHAEKLKQYAVY